VTAAVVATPNHLHAPIATDLLASGMDVLVEKPLAPTIAECRRMEEAATVSGRILAVALPLRFSRDSSHRPVGRGRRAVPGGTRASATLAARRDRRARWSLQDASPDARDLV
jgi:hypothetical protein